MVGRLLRDASRAGSPETAIEVDLGMKTDQLSDEWHAALGRLAQQMPPEKGPEVLIDSQRDRAERSLGVHPIVGQERRRGVGESHRLHVGSSRRRMDDPAFALAQPVPVVDALVTVACSLDRLPVSLR
jgi:hypothetical protein